MSKIVRIWNSIRRNKYIKYIIVLLAFTVIIGLVDENNLMRRFKYELEIHSLKKEIEYYKVIFERDTEQLNELQENPEGIEKVARERYFMKSPNEDIYIFEEDNTNNHE